jgi:predicted regulator of Ras-like GTPase activity (Roadblock/LC7/MglB family)
MTAGRLTAVLDRVTRVRGVQGVLLVSQEDGLVVAESLMEGIRGNAVAALAASLAGRLAKALRVAGVGQSRFVHLASERGALLLLPAPDGLLLVAITDASVNVGLARLELQGASEQLG